MRTILIIFILSFFNECFCSLVSKKETSSLWIINLNYNQIKDELNYGLVNNGMNLGIEFVNLNKRPEKYGTLAASLDLGINTNKGIGANIVFKPIKYYSPNIYSKFDFSLYFETIYNWQMYPDLHSGHLFHLSSYEIGFTYAPQKDFGLDFNFLIKSSLLSLNSKKNWVREEQYYSFDFIDFFRVVNQDLNFNLIGNYYHIELWFPFYKTNSKEFMYNFEFYYLKDKTDIKILNHGIKIQW